MFTLQILKWKYWTLDKSFVGDCIQYFVAFELHYLNLRFYLMEYSILVSVLWNSEVN